MELRSLSHKACLLLCCLPLASTAASNDRFQFSGFASFGIAKSLESDELYGDSTSTIPNETEYRDYSKLGLRATVDLQDNLKFTTQMLAHGRNDFEPEFDWIFLSYNLNPNLVLHIGKYVTSYFMYSDYADIGYAYQWVDAPGIIYTGNINKTLEGAKLVWNARMGGGWTSELSVLVGKDESDASSAGLDTTMYMDDAVGFAWQIDRDWLSLRTSYMYSKTSADFTDTQIEGLTGLASILGSTELNDALTWDDDKTQFVGFGAALNFDHVFVVTEITHARIEDTVILGRQNAGYLTVGTYLPRNVTVALTLYQKRNLMNDDIAQAYQQAADFARANPALFDAAFETAMDTGPLPPGTATGIATGILEDTINDIQKRKREGFTISGRWDFHSNAALKAEYLHEWHKPGNGEKITPSAVRVGIDLVF